MPAGAEQLEPASGRDDIEIRRFGPEEVELDDGHGAFRLDGHAIELELPFTQRHHAVNTLAALHAYAALGLPLERAADGAPDIALSPWRGEELPLPGGGFVVNDAYNANPDSMRAALEHLAERAGGRRQVAILGEMAELGRRPTRYHGEIGALARRARRRASSAWASPRARTTPRRLGARRRTHAVECSPRSRCRAGRRRARQGLARGGARRHRREIANFAEAWSPS